MKNMIKTTSKALSIFAASLLLFCLVACDSNDSSRDNNAGIVSGTIQDIGSPAVQTVQPQALNGATITLDDGNDITTVDSQGYFMMFNVTDGDHSLRLHLANGGTLEIPIRMLNRRNLQLGEITFDKGFKIAHTGFDGYRFGFVDENNDGFNDNFADADGDGICDKDCPYAGSPYLMAFGFTDLNKDGINDNFVDANGDGYCDFSEKNHFGAGFGFVDENNDNINDNFFDADGDGICDHNQTPYSHPFGYVDADDDDINDNFTDADGDGICDNDRLYAGVPYVAMPGWVDANNDNINDVFRDEKGDGFNDLNDIPYAQGFGWEDANRDGINDRIRDRDGDCICDEDCLYHDYHYDYGYSGPHRDQNGDGIDDETGQPFRQGFGWEDSNNDGENDGFSDPDGDGMNDRSGRGYVFGYGHGGL